jgi:hypothetical protein
MRFPLSWEGRARVRVYSYSLTIQESEPAHLRVMCKPKALVRYARPDRASHNRTVEKNLKVGPAFTGMTFKKRDSLLKF